MLPPLRQASVLPASPPTWPPPSARPSTYQLLLLFPMKLRFLSLEKIGEKKPQICDLEENPEFYLHLGF